MQFVHLANLRNTGLQLPKVSPDGKWVAALSCPNTLALEPDAAFTGKTLSDVTLALYSTNDPKLPPRPVATGAAWPVWSADSQKLIAMSYDSKGRCGLIVHDLASNQTARLAVGQAHIVTPTVSPTGKQLALVGFDQIPQTSRLYTYDLESRRLNALPAPKETVWQVNPMWIGDSALLYFGRLGSDTGLLGATTDVSKPHALLAKLPLPQEATECIQSQSGIAKGMSADHRWLATYDVGDARIVLRDLEANRAWPLDKGAQAGCWVASPDVPRFLYSTEKQLMLTTLAQGGQSQGHSQTRVLASSSPLLPIWCDPLGRWYLLLAPGKEDWTFELIKMQITPTP